MIGFVQNLFDYLTGHLRRRTLLGVIFPAMVVVRFGTLVMTMAFPGQFEWHLLSIAQLLHPQRDPQVYPLVATRMALTGVLLIPFAGYLGWRLRAGALRAAQLGTAGVIVGAVAQVLAVMISSQTARDFSGVLARVSVVGIGIGLVMFTVAALQGCQRGLYPRWLAVFWTGMLVPVMVALVARLAAVADLAWALTMPDRWYDSAAWYWGFWEWVGMLLVFVFLGAAVWWLPERAGKQDEALLEIIGAA